MQLVGALALAVVGLACSSHERSASTRRPAVASSSELLGAAGTPGGVGRAPDAGAPRAVRRAPDPFALRNLELALGVDSSPQPAMIWSDNCLDSRADGARLRSSSHPPEALVVLTIGGNFGEQVLSLSRRPDGY